MKEAEPEHIIQKWLVCNIKFISCDTEEKQEGLETATKSWDYAVQPTIFRYFSQGGRSIFREV